MDLNRDGLVSQEEFMQVCLTDDKYTNSIDVFCNVMI